MEDEYTYVEEYIDDKGGYNALLHMVFAPDRLADFARGCLYVAIRASEIIGSVIGIAVLAVTIGIVAVLDFVFG